MVFRKHKKVESGTKGTGKATGWDFLTFRTHKKEKQQAGIFQHKKVEGVMKSGTGRATGR